MTNRDAATVFRKRTGRDPSEDYLQLLVMTVLGALDEVAKQSKAALPQPTRGRPRMNANLASALATITKEVGPADAAILLLLCGAHESTAFPVATATGKSGWDVRATLRRIAQSLSKITKRAAARPRAKRLASRRSRPRSKAPGR